MTPINNQARSKHNPAIADVRRVLKVFDGVGGAVTPEQHVRAMHDHIQAVRTSLSDGLDQPPEAWRLARIAAHAIALMSEESDDNA